MKAKVPCLAACCFVAAMLSYGASARADVLSYYIKGGAAEFGIVDFSNGTSTVLGTPGGGLISGMASYNGALYVGAHLFSAQPDALYRVDPTNGSMTFVGNSGQSNIDIGSTTNGLYEVGYDGNLYSINAATGGSTLIGPTGIPLNGTCCGNGNFGMSAGGPNLYLGQTNDLWLLNTSTGQASLVGLTSPASFGAMVYIGGTYYGTDTFGGEQIYTFDPITAAVTATGEFAPSDIWGLAPNTVTPLPTTLPLFATGLGALGLLGWRKKHKAAALAA